MLPYFPYQRVIACCAFTYSLISLLKPVHLKICILFDDEEEINWQFNMLKMWWFIQAGKFQHHLTMTKTEREVEHIYSSKTMWFCAQMWFCADSDKHVCFVKYCRVWLFLSVQFTYLAMGCWKGAGHETDLSVFLSILLVCHQMPLAFNKFPNNSNSNQNLDSNSNALYIPMF